jgi:small subunit ribosomal protein S20
MAITKNAKKAIRNSEKKRVFNIRRVRQYRTAIRDIEKALEGGDVTSAEAKLPAAYKAIDKALKMSTLKPNTASRRKAGLVRMIKRAKTEA